MEIVNYCRRPSHLAVWYIQKGLKWINPLDSHGVDYLRLIDQLPEPTEKSDQWYKSAIQSGDGIFGWYSPRRARVPAYITLNLKDIYSLVPWRYRYSSVPLLLLTHTIAHEVAHHLVAKRGYIFKSGERHRGGDEEEMSANLYALDVMNRMKSRRSYAFGQWLIKGLAELNYMKGILYWRDAHYRRAVWFWNRAWSLNPALWEAAHWSAQAKKMLQAEEQNN